MGLTLPGVAQETRQRIGLPTVHLLVVAFARLAFGFLAGPAQAALENLADVFGVVRYAEALSDQAGDAIGGPQFVGPAVGLGALEQQLLELAELFLGQPRRGAGSGLGLQAVGL